MTELKPVLVAAALGFIASMSYGIAFDVLNLPTSLNETLSQSSSPSQSQSN